MTRKRVVAYDPLAQDLNMWRQTQQEFQANEARSAQREVDARNDTMVNYMLQTGLRPIRRP